MTIFWDKASTEVNKAEKVYILALDAYGIEDYDKAMELVNKAIKTDKKFYQANLLKAKILFFLDHKEEALKILSKLKSNYPAFTDATMWLIRIKILAGNFDDAKKLLDKELSFNSSDWRIYYLYALLAEKTDNYELRLLMNSRAESALIDSAKLYMDLAISWHAMGMHERVKINLEKARIISESNTLMQELEKSLDNHFQN